MLIVDIGNQTNYKSRRLKELEAEANDSEEAKGSDDFD
jgi:hypothetical protein